MSELLLIGEDRKNGHALLGYRRNTDGGILKHTLYRAPVPLLPNTDAASARRVGEASDAQAGFQAG